MVTPGTALRGEVWACAFPQPVGPRPAVVLTVNRVAAPLSSVTVALITDTSGPQVTHVPIGSDAGLTNYDESYVNCADLHTVAKCRLRRKLGLLAATDLKSVEDSVRLILGLQP